MSEILYDIGAGVCLGLLFVCFLALWAARK